MKTVVAAVSAAKTYSRPAQSTQSLLAMASGGRIISELALTAAFNSTYPKPLTMHSSQQSQAVANGGQSVAGLKLLVSRLNWSEFITSY
jgi:hypothetical protein